MCRPRSAPPRREATAQDAEQPRPWRRRRTSRTCHRHHGGRGISGLGTSEAWCSSCPPLGSTLFWVLASSALTSLPEHLAPVCPTTSCLTSLVSQYKLYNN